METEYFLDETVEVELASSWERISAYILNNVFMIIALIPMLIGFFSTFENDGENPEFGVLFWIGILTYLAFGVYQIYLMSKYGQSLGKKLLNLRVIKTNGGDAGFVNVVLLREVVYQVGVGLMAGIFGVMGDIGSVLGSIVQLGMGTACLAMLFVHSERRTLQDMIADTIVIKMPR